MNKKNGETLRIERPGMELEAEVTYDNVRRPTEVKRKHIETNLKEEKIGDIKEIKFSE